VPDLQCPNSKKAGTEIVVFLLWWLLNYELDAMQKYGIGKLSTGRVLPKR
jgi:hypothetical protein